MSKVSSKKRTTGIFGLSKNDITGGKLTKDQIGIVSTKLYEAYGDTVLVTFGKLEIHHLIEETQIVVVIQEKEQIFNRKWSRRPEREFIAFDLQDNKIYFDVKDSDEEIKFDFSETQYSFPKTIPALIKTIKLVVESFVHGILFSECERRVIQLRTPSNKAII